MHSTTRVVEHSERSSECSIGSELCNRSGIRLSETYDSLKRISERLIGLRKTDTCEPLLSSDPVRV